MVLGGGTSSCSSPRRFGCKEPDPKVTPGILPPGRLRLLTRPVTIGSPPLMNTIETIIQSRAGALLIGNSILFNNRRRQLAALAARHGVPAIGSIREFVMAGGLMSYGASDSDAYHRA